MGNNSVKFDKDTPAIVAANKVQSLMAVNKDTGEVGNVEFPLLVQEAGKHVADAVKVTGNVLPTLGDANKRYSFTTGSAGRTLTHRATSLVYGANKQCSAFWDGVAKVWTKEDEVGLPEGLNYKGMSIDSSNFVFTHVDKNGRLLFGVKVSGDFIAQLPQLIGFDNRISDLERRNNNYGLNTHELDNVHGVYQKNRSFDLIFDKDTKTAKTISNATADLSKFDRACAVIQIEGPNKERIIIAGLGARDYNASSFPHASSTLQANCILRSTDYGETWTAITPTGKTDRKVYGFSTNSNGVVVAVTGDRQEPCIISSTDYGLTWAVRKTTAQIGSDASLYNSYYLKDKNIFVVPTGTGVFTSIDGVDFTKDTTYSIPTGRNGFYVDELEELWVATQGTSLKVLRKGAKVASDALSVPGYNVGAFKYLENGIMLAVAWKEIYPTAITKNATKITRKGNILYVRIPNHNLSDGMLMATNIASNHPMYNKVQSSLKIKVIDVNEICCYQFGQDATYEGNIQNLKFHDGVEYRIYRSTNYGASWSYKSYYGFNYEPYVVWGRDFIYMGNGVVYFNVAGSENVVDTNSCTLLKSTDYGDTFNLTWDFPEKINAIYRSVGGKGKTVIAGGQSSIKIYRIN